MLSFFPRDVSDEILDLIESVSRVFPTYSSWVPDKSHYLSGSNHMPHGFASK